MVLSLFLAGSLLSSGKCKRFALFLPCLIGGR